MQLVNYLLRYRGSRYVAVDLVGDVLLYWHDFKLCPFVAVRHVQWERDGLQLRSLSQASVINKNSLCLSQASTGNAIHSQLCSLSQASVINKNSLCLSQASTVSSIITINIVSLDFTRTIWNNPGPAFSKVSGKFLRRSKEHLWKDGKFWKHFWEKN